MCFFCVEIISRKSITNIPPISGSLEDYRLKSGGNRRGGDMDSFPGGDSFWLQENLGGGFKDFYRFFIVIPIWGRFPFSLIFFKWVETTS